MGLLGTDVFSNAQAPAAAATTSPAAGAAPQAPGATAAPATDWANLHIPTDPNGREAENLLRREIEAFHSHYQEDITLLQQASGETNIETPEQFQEALRIAREKLNRDNPPNKAEIEAQLTRLENEVLPQFRADRDKLTRADAAFGRHDFPGTQDILSTQSSGNTQPASGADAPDPRAAAQALQQQNQQSQQAAQTLLQTASAQQPHVNFNFGTGSTTTVGSGFGAPPFGSPMVSTNTVGFGINNGVGGAGNNFNVGSCGGSFGNFGVGSSGFNFSIGLGGSSNDSMADDVRRQNRVIQAMIEQVISQLAQGNFEMLATAVILLSLKSKLTTTLASYFTCRSMQSFDRNMETVTEQMNQVGQSNASGSQAQFQMAALQSQFNMQSTMRNTLANNLRAQMDATQTVSDFESSILSKMERLSQSSYRWG